jgi:NADPH:quinone reductase
VSNGRVLVRITAAGVTPLDHTILSEGHPRAKAPLVLGNEGAGVVEASGDDRFPDGSRVMFTGPYGVYEDGAFSEWVAVKKADLCLIHANIDDAAAGVPVACLTALITLRAAGFVPGKTVFAPGYEAAFTGHEKNSCAHVHRRYPKLDLSDHISLPTG